jgi:hypothetical protein
LKVGSRKLLCGITEIFKSSRKPKHINTSASHVCAPQLSSRYRCPQRNCNLSSINCLSSPLSADIWPNYQHTFLHHFAYAVQLVTTTTFSFLFHSSFDWLISSNFTPYLKISRARGTPYASFPT